MSKITDTSDPLARRRPMTPTFDSQIPVPQNSVLGPILLLFGAACWLLMAVVFLSAIG